MTICQIRDLNSEGDGVASIDAYTLFIPGALVGEEVECDIFERRKNFGRARLKAILQPSKDRKDPPCPYYPTCGGCQLQHLSYEGQLHVKTHRVQETLRRIGKIDVDVNACIPSDNPFHYRNKLQYSCRDNKIGLLQRDSHDLIDIDACLINSHQGEETYRILKPLLQSRRLESLRYLILKGDGELVILVTDREEDLTSLGKEILSLCPHTKGVIQNINDKPGNVVLGSKYRLLAGQERVKRTLLGITTHLSAASFVQVNSSQTEKLYRHALDAANLTGQETLLDAYCGVGTLTLLFAQKCRRSIGIECVPQAIEDAKENAKVNGIDNAQFRLGFAEKAIKEVGPFDIALLNPPRKGCDPLLLQRLVKSAPKTVLYISCNPTTLARDLALLTPHGYRIDHVQPFDMFPQTAHVETFVKLVKEPAEEPVEG